MIHDTGNRPCGDLAAVADGVARGVTSARVRAEEAIDRATAHDADYGVYITRMDSEVLEAAGAIDRMASTGDSPGPLAGVTVAVKDFIATRDAPTTAQSVVHPSVLPPGRDASAVAALRAAGALITGKTSMAEHAMGRVDPRLPFPIPRNAWDPGRWPGGSSCGSAIAVALGLSDAALGTDTTGSLRIPAAFCGITALRPTQGLIPLDGVLPASPSLDALGPMARSARACAEILAVLAPSTALSDGRSAAPWRRTLNGTVIGVPDDVTGRWRERIAPDIHDGFQRALGVLSELGARIVPIPLVEFQPLAEATLILTMSETFAIHAETLRTRWSEYGRSFRRSAAIGALVRPGDLERARSQRSVLRRQLASTMAPVDVLVLPTWAQPPPEYSAGVDMAPDDLNLTAPFSATGLPSLATPMGWDSSGLPMSMQFIGKAGSDLDLLAIAASFEEATALERRIPSAAAGPFPPIPDPDATSAPATAEQRAAVDAAFNPQGIHPEESDVPALCAVMELLAARVGEHGRD